MSDTWKGPPTEAGTDARTNAGTSASRSPESASPDRPEGGRPDRLWPTLIVAGMVVVVMVNAAFIWIAVDGADEVVPSYMEEER
ncbi:MAG TPA: hypothetical protein VJ925_09445 [Longimicrobiales bacterium]|nr:hypothetical protein [Longimicrobiales bacterium]